MGIVRDPPGDDGMEAELSSDSAGRALGSTAVAVLSGTSDALPAGSRGDAP